jgi:hypothetical protein
MKRRDDLYLYRTIQTKKHTLGVLVYKDKMWFSLELPWKNNAIRESCIVADTYDLSIDFSQKNGLKEHKNQIVELESKHDRSQIQIHVGNSSSDTKGCILIGQRVNNARNNLKLQLSLPAYKEFFTEVYNSVKTGQSKLHIIDTFMK